ISQWSDPAATDRGIAWGRDTYAALGPFFGGTRYVNYLDHDETGNPAAVAYGPNYEGLRQLKAVYDPENFFHTNVNIRPALRGRASNRRSPRHETHEIHETPEELEKTTGWTQ